MVSIAFILTAFETVVLAAIRGPDEERVKAAPRTGRQIPLHFGKTAEPAANRAADSIGAVPIIAAVGIASPMDGRGCAHLPLLLLRKPN